jgi:hypothetical protein
MDAETWYTAEEAKAAGFADEVIPSVDIAARFDLRKYQKTPEALRVAPDSDLERIRAEGLAIVTACNAAGAPELAVESINNQMTLDQVNSVLLDPEKLRSARARWVSDDVKEIHSLCVKAGVAELSEQFINEGRPLAWVQERLAEASSIRARVLRVSALAAAVGKARGRLYQGRVQYRGGSPQSIRDHSSARCTGDRQHVRPGCHDRQHKRSA